MKNSVSVLMLMLMSLITLTLFVGCSTKETNISEEPYVFEGKNDVSMDDRSLVLEDVPENQAEETVINDFLYKITSDFDSMLDNLADIESHKISVKNTEKSSNDGVYIKSIVIHEISTLEEGEYNVEKLENGDYNPLYYYGWKEFVEEYNLEEFEIINVKYTQAFTVKAIEQMPQWGDGTYSRSFIVGKTAEDHIYKLYDYGFM